MSGLVPKPSLVQISATKPTDRVKTLQMKNINQPERLVGD
jgi:hypothetical protein